MLFIQAMRALFRGLVLWKEMSSPTLEGWTQDGLRWEMTIPIYSNMDTRLISRRGNEDSFKYMYDNDCYYY